MLKLILSAAVLMVSACQAEEIGSRAEVATAEMNAEQDTSSDETEETPAETNTEQDTTPAETNTEQDTSPAETNTEQDTSPLYAEFEDLRDYKTGASAHVAVKVTYVGSEPDKMYVKDLRGEGRAEAVEITSVSSRSTAHGALIVARGDKQIFSLIDLPEKNAASPRYQLQLETGNRVKLYGPSTELYGGTGTLTEEKWNRLRRIPDPAPTPPTSPTTDVCEKEREAGIICIILPIDTTIPGGE